MNTFSPFIEGLEDLQESLSFKKVEKSLALAMASAVWKLHAALKFETHNRYITKNNLSLDSVLVNKSSSSVKFGKNIIESGLEYKDKPLDLSKFPYEWEWGNINSPVKREGRVHSVTILRGKSKIVYGKKHFGGFVPRKGKNAEGKVFQNNFGAQMFERETDERLPLRVLFGPSLANQVEYVYDTNLGEVGKFKENLTSFIASQLEW